MNAALNVNLMTYLSPVHSEQNSPEFRLPAGEPTGNLAVFGSCHTGALSYTYGCICNAGSDQFNDKSVFNAWRPSIAAFGFDVPAIRGSGRLVRDTAEFSSRVA